MDMNRASILVCTLSWTFLLCSTAVVDLSGDHICHKQENYTETVNATKSEPMQVRKNFWCIEKIRCSELQSEIKEVVRVENVTRSRVIKFCCPGYEEFEDDGGKRVCRSNETIVATSTTPRYPAKGENQTGTLQLLSTEKNPYQNYSGEYGKEFNHYVKMGLNDSDPQQSVNKIVEYEIEKANEDFQRKLAEGPEYIIVDVANEIEPLKHPQYISDHHVGGHHEEAVAMVTVGCLVLGMCIFLIIMVYIMRKQMSRDDDIRDIEFLDPRFESKKTKLPPSKIVHEPLPIPPLRPSLRKHKSVTFDNSIDEVDEFNRRRTRSLPDAYDVPRKPTSMIDLYAHSVKISPKDIATYAVTQKSFYHTFPKKSVSRKTSVEHIYDEIPTPHIAVIKENEKPAEIIYTNMSKKPSEANVEEKTKM